jgi:hypothetical protein
MPLVTGPRAATPAGIQENIERLIAEGKPVEQAVAIAHRIAEEAHR